MKILTQLGILSAILISSMCAHAAADSVTRDAQTGDWIFSVTDPESNEQRTWRYVPRNQFQPRIHDALRWNGQQFEYNYRLHNDRKSKQAISFLWVTDARMGMADIPLRDERTITDFSTQAEWWAIGARDDKAKDAYLKKFITDPKGWHGRISVGKQNIARQFGWFANAKNLSSDLAPGQTLRGANVLRPELPGVGIAGMQGDTEERGRAGDLPDTGPLADAWNQIAANDELKVPVMVPAVVVPVPYNAAELARRLRAEISYWSALAVARPDVIDRLNRQFEVLIPALELNNKIAVRGAVQTMLIEVFGHHKGMTHRHVDEDDEDHDTEALPPKGMSDARERKEQPAQPALHRVAARALVFDLVYLLTREELGK